jgi:demethylmenaquinone methyltransferase/2-methoxy-6-polyprenyl-1,4-benzoquinol methylase
MATQKPRIELTGFKARHYDGLLDMASAWRYGHFLRRVLDDLAIEPGERILDLGAGTGRIAALMAERTGPAGRVVGVEIGPEMRARFRRRAARIPNLELVDRRIEHPLDLGARFDRVLVSFVLHGLEQHQRILVVQNAAESLAEDGRLCILDWNERDLAAFHPLARALFKRFECAQARDFIARDWRTILSDYRFDRFQAWYYMRGYFRLLTGQKF